MLSLLLLAPQLSGIPVLRVTPPITSVSSHPPCFTFLLVSSVMAVASLERPTTPGLSCVLYRSAMATYADRSLPLPYQTKQYICLPALEEGFCPLSSLHISSVHQGCSCAVLMAAIPPQCAHHFSALRGPHSCLLPTQRVRPWGQLPLPFPCVVPPDVLRNRLCGPTLTRLMQMQMQMRMHLHGLLVETVHPLPHTHFAILFVHSTSDLLAPLPCCPWGKG
eukprot:GGOE01008761.1.p4 GENE.GGOE01008761.1~~GGOE01008761.1.p4  ORF type:complete len:221 (+),score=23.85 GGOE01008761.1:1923-2585(+)